MVKMGENGMVEYGKEQKTRPRALPKNKCSHEQALVNLWNICKLYPFCEPMFSSDPPFLPFLD